MTDKLTLPKAKFAHELTAGPVDPTMKAAEATSAKLYRVPIEKIKIIPGFNVRVPSADYIEHRDNLAELIRANGYDGTKPLAGYVAKEGDENVIYVTDGHTRLDAVSVLNSEAKKADKITALPVLVHPKEVSLIDLTVGLHTANSGRPLTPFELGIVVKRLLAEDGASKKDIAARLAVTTRYLDDVLLLANAAKEVKQHVATGSVSSTMAIQLLRADPDTAAEKIEKAVKTAASTGKKATRKHAGPKMKKIKVSVPFEAGDDMKEIVKAVAAKVRESVAAEEGEDDVKLSTVEGTINLVIEVPVPEKPKAKTKPKKAAAEKKASDKKVSTAKKADAAADKPKRTEKPEAKAKRKKAEADIGIEGAEEVSSEGEDDEVAMVPPKVVSDPEVPDDEEVDI